MLWCLQLPCDTCHVSRNASWSESTVLTISLKTRPVWFGWHLPSSQGWPLSIGTCLIPRDKRNTRGHLCLGCWSLSYWCLGYWYLGYWSLSYWCLCNWCLCNWCLATDVLATDILATDILATGIFATDILATDILATDILARLEWKLTIVTILHFEVYKY